MTYPPLKQLQLKGCHWSETNLINASNEQDWGVVHLEVAVRYLDSIEDRINPNQFGVFKGYDNKN
jgi:hypothetical protein